MRNYLFVLSGLAFIAGIGFAFIFSNLNSIILLAVLLFSFFLLFFVNNRKWFLFLVVLIIFITGIFRTQLIPLDDIDIPFDKNIVLSGEIVGDIEKRNDKIRYVLDTGEYKVLVYEPFLSPCESGESVSGHFSLNEPESFVTDYGRIFDYKKYLNLQGIYAISFLQESICEGENNFTLFVNLREYILDIFSKLFKEPESSLLGGLLLGLRGNLTQELLLAFSLTGLIHIIVLSGHNVTIVAEAIRRVFSFAPKRIAVVLSIISIILFIILSGLQITGIRAGLMAIIAIIARSTYREYDGIRALVLVAALFAAYDPEIILFSTSFHLSFLATIGILVFSPLFDRLFSFVTDRFQLRSVISITIGTQLFLLPYLAYSIGAFSLVGVLANIIVLPVIPFAMLFGVLVSIAYIIYPPLGLILSPIAYFPLHYIVVVAEKLAMVAYASVNLPEIPLVFLLSSYAVLFYIGFKFFLKEEDNDIFPK